MKVLVLHASALHLGFLGCYGNTWIATPNLDRLAAEGVVFDQHYADHLGQRTCLTGQHQWQDEMPMASPNKLVPAEAGLVIHVQPQPVPAGSDASPLEQTMEGAADAVERLAGQSRGLCWVDLPSLHPPWQVADEFSRPYLAEEQGEAEDDDEAEENEPFAALPDPAIGPLDGDDLVVWERMRCTYAGAVTYLDAGLGLLFEELKQRELLDALTIVFTADRGLALGEHGIVGDYLPWLHDEVVHVPLIVRQPGGADGGLRIMALTQSVDVAATLVDLFGVRGQSLDGHSWLPLVRGEMTALRQHAISRWQLGDAEEWSLRTLDCALVLPFQQPPDIPPRRVQLFLKPEDRWEVNNVVQHHLELAEELELKLRKLCDKG